MFTGTGLIIVVHIHTKLEEGTLYIFIYLQSSKDLLQPSSGGEERSVRALRDGPLAVSTEWGHSVALVNR